MGKYKPYPAYRDSGVDWLGEVPEAWPSYPAFRIVRECKQSNSAGQEANVLSLSYGRIIRRDVETNFGLLPESFNTYQIVNTGNLILRLTDLQNDQRSLRVGQVKERGIITSAYLCLDQQQELHARFSYYLLHSYDTMKVFYGMGGGLRQSMKFSDLRRLPLLCPSVEEQSQIAAFLDHETAKIDRLIEKQEKLIELLKEKRQAVVSHAVTKGLDPNAPMKDSGVDWLGEIPAHWQVKRLKHVAILQSGLAKGRTLRNVATLQVPYLRVANVQDGYVKLDDVAEMEIEHHELSRYLLQAGDVLMNEGGDNDKLGRGTVWNAEIHPCIHQNHVFAIRSRQIEPEWISLLTQSSYAKFHFYCKAKQSTNLASISATNIMETPLVVPPAEDRKAISQHIARLTLKIDNLDGVSRRKIQLLQERRTALISAAVTGKIDVREWQPEQAS